MGFFTREEIEQDFAIQQMENPLPACKKCGMHVGCLHPRTEYTGEGRKDCLIVAEANGPDEDEIGTQLIGTVGKWFRDKLSEHDLDLDRDFWKLNAVNCFPHNSDRTIRPPTRVEIDCCRPLVEKALKETNPRFIWLLGNHALESFYMKEFSDLKITRWRNLLIPDSRYNAWVLPMFHPSFVRRTEGKDLNLDARFDADLKFAVSALRGERRPEKLEPRESCECLYSFDEIYSLLYRLETREPANIVIDYETTGLKPQAPGHKIVSVSIMEQGSTVAYSFPFQYRDYFDRNEQLEIKRLLRSILSNPRIGKIAHNFKFEHAWSEFILGVYTNNWKFDTMLCAHILDTRKKFTGLKFQSYINFGVYPYDKYVKQYKQDKKGTGFNTMDDCPIDSLLLYGAMDAYLTYRLYLKQQDKFCLTESLNEKNKLSKAYRFFHEGNIAFCEIQANGISMNEKYYKETEMEISRKIAAMYKKLAESDQAKKFADEVGREMSLRGQNSSKDLKKLLVDVLEIDMPRTLKDNISTDEKVLAKIDIPFTRQLVKIRKLEKVYGTYFAEFKREMCNGKMYPFFDLNLPRSLRSSSSKPNFQNIPVRNAEAKKMCRSGIVPSPGNQLLESDYSGIEVSIAACYTRDPTLVAHVTDPKADMHRDSAADVWILPVEEVTSEIRFYAKNCWVFPQFYGSYYGNCADDLWEAVIEQNLRTRNGDLVVDRLLDQGVNSLDAFKEHCQDVEHDFWNNRFRVYKQWKDDIQVEFRKLGYFETYFGFRFHGHLSYNQLSNYPIQGTAFHCLLWTLIRLQKEVKEYDYLSKIIGQIHDSIVWDAHPNEVKNIVERTLQIGTEDIVKENPWINVPLDIEFEITPIDGSWYEKEPYP